MTKCVLQDWVLNLPLMQQTVLLTAIRGPDNTPKYGPVKMLMRWYRRCVLISALDNLVLRTPSDPRGGSFTGPSIDSKGPDVMHSGWEPDMDRIVDEYLRTVDALPHHFHMHLMHAAEIIGYQHSDARIASWWLHVYYRFARDMHLTPETLDALNERLGDSRANWLKHADKATVA